MTLSAQAMRIDIFDSSGSRWRRISNIHCPFINFDRMILAGPHGRMNLMMALRGATPGEPRDGYFVLDSLGKIIDTVVRPRESMIVRGPFHPKPEWGIGNDAALATSRPDDGYRITIVNEERQIQVVERADAVPIAISDEERRDIDEFNAEMARRGYHKSLPAPANKPFIAYLELAPDARLWTTPHVPSVKKGPPNDTTVPAVPWEEPTVRDVFDNDGVYLGRLTFPPDAYWIKSWGNRVWGYGTTADGFIQLIGWVVEPDLLGHK